MNPSVAKPTIQPVYQPWGFQTLHSVAGFVVSRHNSISIPYKLQECRIWMCVNLPKKLSQQRSNPYMVQNLEMRKWNINGIVSPACDGSSSTMAATNQQNSVTDVVLLSQIQIIAISEAIQQAHHNN